MKPQVSLLVASLLSILLFTFHWTDDMVRGFERGGLNNSGGFVILFVWLWGTVVLSGRRSGQVITAIGGLLGTVVPLLHMKGGGLMGGNIRGSEGDHFWAWTLVALGVTGAFSLALSLSGLWQSFRRGPVQGG